MTEAFTGTPGRSVSRADTLAGCKAILDGEADDWAESSLYMIGNFDEARQKEATAVKKEGTQVMRLRITTPLEVVVDEEGVQALRAEDSSGGFGILAGHADFLTSLAISVVRWKTMDETRRYCAVRRGVLSVAGGQDISIATRDAVLGDDLATLAETVLARFRADLENERSARIDSTRLELSAIRQIVSHLRGSVGIGGFS